jgi:kumamolisin
VFLRRLPRGAARLAALLAVLSATLVSSANTWGSASSSGPLVPLGSAGAAPGSAGAQVLDAAAQSAPVSLGLQLAPQDPALLEQTAAEISTPGSPEFRHFITVSQFAALFGAPQGEIAALQSYLQAAGLGVGQVSSNGLYLPLTGTAAQVDAALHVSMDRVELSSGRVVVGSSAVPQLPTALAGDVEQVTNLTPWTTEQPGALPTTPAARTQAEIRTPSLLATSTPPYSECSGMSDAVNPPVGSPQLAQLDANAMSSLYQLGGFYSGSDWGQGVTVGLVEYSEFNQGDVSTYGSCLDITPDVTSVGVNPGAAFGDSGIIEADSDIEVLLGTAPRAAIEVFYPGPAGEDPLEEIVSPPSGTPLPQVASTSWFGIESSADLQSIDTEETYLQEAVLQGQTVLAASGDYGSEAAEQVNSSDTSLSVAWPSDEADITSVGGTELDNTSQELWNSTLAAQSSDPVIGATGGG